MADQKSLARLITEKNRQKTPEQDFQHMLEEAIVRIHVRDSKPPSQAFKPSSLGGCLRNMYYQVVGAPSEKSESDESADSIGIMESGTDRHARIQKAISEMKELDYPVEWIDVEDYLKKHPQHGTIVKEKKGMETKLFNEVLNLSFLCDGIFLMRGVYYVLEIKTEVSMKFDGRTQAEDNHITQAACYSATLGIDRIMYVYENRDFCKKKFMLYTVTEEDKFSRVVAPIEEVNAHKENGTIPSKTTKTKFCKYCAYQNRCKKDGDT